MMSTEKKGRCVKQHRCLIEFALKECLAQMQKCLALEGVTMINDFAISFKLNYYIWHNVITRREVIKSNGQRDK